MKNMINRLGRQGQRLRVIPRAAVIVFFLTGCGNALSGGWNSYFEFDSASGTITGYDDDGPKSVTLPSSINGIRVTAIGKNAFRNKRLTGVRILTGITTIEEGAFADNRLTSVIILDSVVTIRASAFENNLLTTVTIPNSVVIIGAGAFENNLLTTVTIGSNVESIGKRAFAVNQLSSIAIPNNVESIETDAFSGNPLTSVTIGPDKEYASNIVSSFGETYNDNKMAGRYTRTDTNSSTWTKQL